MPLFAFISGHFSKSNVDDKSVHKVQKLFLMYLVFQVLYAIARFLMLGEIMSPMNIVFVPYHLMWFILSLAFWRMLLPYVAKERLLIVVAILLGLMIGYVGAGSTLSLSRTVVFFPFFLAGYHMKREHILALNKLPFRLTGATLLIIGLFLSFRFNTDINPFWLFNKFPYASGGYTEFHRAGYYLLASVMGLSFLSILPRGKTMVTGLGSATLYVYLFHGFFVMLYRSLNFYNTQPISMAIAYGVIVSVGLFYSPRLLRLLPKK